MVIESCVADVKAEKRSIGMGKTSSYTPRKYVPYFQEVKVSKCGQGEGNLDQVLTYSPI